MADYAIGLSFHKAHRTIVRAVELTPPTRYFATRDGAGYVTLPTTAPGTRRVEIQGIRQTSFQIQDNNQEFRLLGDNGWNDSLITGSSVNASVSAYFLKDTQLTATTGMPTFKGNYEEGFQLIQKSRYNKDYEIYIEFMKELGRSDGETGDYIYDFTGFNACIQNYQEQVNPEGLTEVSFDLMSRGRPVFGLYNAGSTPISFGGIQSNLLEFATGVRQYASSPLNNQNDVAVDSAITITYTTNGTTPMTNLYFPSSGGSGYRLETGGGTFVPSTVSLVDNVVTVTPDAPLTAGRIYRLKVQNAAIYQDVDGTGEPSSTGLRTPIEGFISTFRTASA